jgi:hypothetical protein
MIPLTFYAAIFYKIASGAFLQLDVINFCGAASRKKHRTS